MGALAVKAGGAVAARRWRRRRIIAVVRVHEAGDGPRTLDSSDGAAQAALAAADRAFAAAERIG